MAEALGQRRRPYKNDPLLELLFKRGLEHEKSYVTSLQASGRQIVDLSGSGGHDEAVDRTLEAMRSGADVIVQGALRNAQWFGRPDVLQRVQTASALGTWSYEVTDTKLARETRAGTILQLGLYSELLASAQGKCPEHFHVITPATVPTPPYRVDDYSAYVRLIRTQLEETVVRDSGTVATENYPEPVEHCEICPWCQECDAKRHRDDHLSLVAGISRPQRRELNANGVATLTALAQLAVPLPFKPKRGAAETFVRVHDQARVQLESRGKTSPTYELRDFEDAEGLLRLPEPSPGDLFLDLEGDPFAVEGGREYLFGVVSRTGDWGPSYRGFWAVSDDEERQAFESVIDLIVATCQTHPTMHVYHYAPYEPSAFKRLMGRYATRESELDRLLRAERFVDLYAVVRQGLIVGVEQYSIKNLESLYGFARAIPLRDANRSLRVVEHALELNAPGDVPEEVRATVEGYNKDDCLSTLHLRDWLEEVRGNAIAAGADLPRPTSGAAEASDRVDERAQRVDALRAKLLSGVTSTAVEPEQRARWLLAYLLDWHRREDKATWWEYFRLRDLTDDELTEEPEAIAGMEFAARVRSVTHGKTGKPTGSVVDRYRFPIQEMEVGSRDELKLTGGTAFGRVIDVRSRCPNDRYPEGRHSSRHSSCRGLRAHVRAY